MDSNSPNLITPVKRIQSIDAFRGFVMLLMMAEVLHLQQVAKNNPDKPVWDFLALQQSHVPWVGCTLHDLIQPSFSFLVGVALPFSIAGRVIQGSTNAWLFLHAFWRSIVLIFLGIFLRSVGRNQTNYTFEDTLTQIGLGYFFLFVLGFLRLRWQWMVLILLLSVYWLAFALYPAPGPEYNYAAVGVSADWPHHQTGFASHWNKNSNLAAAFDRWFLNLFPRENPFLFNAGGYTTLSFFPTLATMIFGLIAGTWLRTESTKSSKWLQFVLTGVGLIAVGYLWNLSGTCPMVKRIWTPSWTLFSAGWCFLLLSLFYLLNDMTERAGWSLPLRVIGMNSIAAYFIAHAPISDAIDSALKTHGITAFIHASTQKISPLCNGLIFLAIAYMLLHWMYRRKIFIKV